MPFRPEHKRYTIMALCVSNYPQSLLNVLEAFKLRIVELSREPWFELVDDRGHSLQERRRR